MQNKVFVEVRPTCPTLLDFVNGGRLKLGRRQPPKNQQNSFYPPTQSFNAFPQSSPMAPPMMHDNGMSAMSILNREGFMESWAQNLSQRDLDEGKRQGLLYVRGRR
jgi:hypothetical protein